MQHIDPATLRVAVLAGGTSSERAISLMSGEQACKALQEAGYHAQFIDTQDAAAACRSLIEGAFDVAFIALHGKGGEDGGVQGLCEVLGIPYTCSGILASALAMDKARSKVVYRACGLPVAESCTLRRGGAWDAAALVARVGHKSVVKPIGSGSSVGMSIVHDVSELAHALDLAFSVSEDVLVESYVEGTEITVAVLGNEELEPLPIVEIVPHAEFYDFEVKYSAAGADHVIPARLDPQVYAKAQEYALAAHRALGCRGVSRSDFIVTPEGTPVILETNTVPGMTPTSLLPDAARHAGYTFSALCSHLIDLALEQG